MRCQALLLILFADFFCPIYCKKFKDEDKPSWAKKDIRDYNDADLERLLEQWEVNIITTNHTRTSFFSLGRLSILCNLPESGTAHVSQLRSK